MAMISCARRAVVVLSRAVAIIGYAQTCGLVSEETTVGYALIAPLPEKNKITLNDVCKLLTRRFDGGESVSVTMNSRGGVEAAHIIVRFGKWSLRVHLEDAAHVIDESREIAALYAGGRPDQDVIAQCGRRITIDTDDDIEMVHFNDYVLVCEAIEEAGPVALFDPQAEGFLNN